MKFVPVLGLTLAAGIAFAQDTTDNYEMAKLGITMNGYDCEKVITVTQTDNKNVLEITCQKSAGSDANVVYIFTIDGAGFSVAPK
jgi:hypothetical protein